MEYLQCGVCKKDIEVEGNSVGNSEFVGDYICDICEVQGWWVDPAGGLHNPDEDSEDYAAQYE